MTLPGPSDTGVMGSSLGGICSLTLAWERPDIFGGAASLSGSFQMDGRWFLEGVLGPYQGPPKPIRVYLDSGTRSGGGDDGAAPTQLRARRPTRQLTFHLAGQVVGLFFTAKSD